MPARSDSTLLIRQRLRLQRKRGGREGVSLRHRFFTTIQTVDDKLAEEREADFAVHRQHILRCAIGEEDLVRRIGAPEVKIFPDLNDAFGARDEGAPIAPATHAVGGEPVDPGETGDAVVENERSLSDVFEFGLVGVATVVDASVDDAATGASVVVKKLIKLVGSDVGQDASVARFLKKPVGVDSAC